MSCGNCPYEIEQREDEGISDCTSVLAYDALAMLKEQDPVEPELEGGGSTWWHVCGECHGAIDTSDRYCKHCGRRIKHEKKAE
jgi:hypothetical protein